MKKASIFFVLGLFFVSFCVLPACPYTTSASPKPNVQKQGLNQGLKNGPKDGLKYGLKNGLKDGLKNGPKKGQVNGSVNRPVNNQPYAPMDGPEK